MTRPIRYAGPENQYRECNAIHRHHADGWNFWGDGRHVLVVVKGRKSIICEVVGEDGLTSLGDPFLYSNFFLPEELQAPEEATP